MGSVTAIVFLGILLVLQLNAAFCDFPSPLLSPIFDDVCKEVECGKGTCKPSKDSALFYECACDHGWSQTGSDHDISLKFLPCIVPNCTINHSCSSAPSPAQDKAVKSNGSIFDPCYWIDCGGGTCNKTSTFAYSCACAEGYSNLLNTSSFTCVKDCSIGLNCADLGISMPNTSPPSPPTPVAADNSGSDVVVNCFQLMIVAMSLVVVL